MPAQYKYNLLLSQGTTCAVLMLHLEHRTHIRVYRGLWLLCTFVWSLLLVARYALLFIYKPTSVARDKYLYRLYSLWEKFAMISEKRSVADLTQMCSIYYYYPHLYFRLWLQ